MPPDVPFNTSADMMQATRGILPTKAGGSRDTSLKSSETRPEEHRQRILMRRPRNRSDEHPYMRSKESPTKTIPMVSMTPLLASRPRKDTPAWENGCAALLWPRETDAMHWWDSR